MCARAASQAWCPLWSGPSVSSMTPTGLPRADPDGRGTRPSHRSRRRQRGGSQGGANAGWQTLSSRNRCIPYDTGEDHHAELPGGIRWSSCPYSVSTSSPTLAVLAFASAHRRWVPRGKNVDVPHLEWAYFDKSSQLPDIQMHT